MNISADLGILVVIAGVGIAVKWLKFPYTPALVLVGTVIGFWKIFPTIHFTPQLLFTVLLPPLLFEGSLRLPWKTLKENGITIFLLAVPGVLLTIFILAPLFHFFLPFSFPVSFLLAALLAATDPVAVLNTFRSLSVDENLSMLMEGESLFNDGTAMVAFGITLVILQTGVWSPMGSFIQFLEISLGGLILGGILGLLFTLITRHLNDHLIEITLSTILAYGSYLSAVEIHVSGLLAVVGAGLVYGNAAAQYGLSPEVKRLLFDVWEYFGFLTNSIIFLLIGTQVNSRYILGYWKPVFLVYLCLMAARFVMAGLSWTAVRFFRQKFPVKWLGIVWWGGLRGALSLALAMGISSSIPDHKALFFITLGVVILFLMVNGLTTGVWVRGLGLSSAKTVNHS